MVGRGFTHNLADEEVCHVNQLLSSNDLQLLDSPAVRSYSKAVVKGKTIFSKMNIRVKKRNSYTVAYTDPNSDSVCFGIIERFITATTNCYTLAVVNQLAIQHVGPPHDFKDTLTKDSHALLFENYVTFSVKNEFKIIFVHNILKKCFNLTNSSWSVLTIPVNSIENE